MKESRSASRALSVPILDDRSTANITETKANDRLLHFMAQPTLGRKPRQVWSDVRSIATSRCAIRAAMLFTIDTLICTIAELIRCSLTRIDTDSDLIIRVLRAIALTVRKVLSPHEGIGCFLGQIAYCAGSLLLKFLVQHD